LELIATPDLKDITTTSDNTDTLRSRNTTRWMPLLSDVAVTF